MSGSRPEVVCAINPEKVFIWPLCAGDLPREYFYFGLPARQVVSANHFERVADSRVTTFSHRIATHSPFARTGNRTDLPSWITPGLVDSLVKALDSLKLTQTSALTAPRSCTEVRIPFPPPPSLQCRESWLNSPDNLVEWPQFREFPFKTGPEKMSL